MEVSVQLRLQMPPRRACPTSGDALQPRHERNASAAGVIELIGFGRWVDGFARGRAAGTAKRLLPLLQPEDSILDVGAGEGLIAAQLHCGLGGCTVLTDLKNQVRSGLPLVLCSGEQLPFADSTFDVVLLLTVLHHTSDPVSIVREAARIAKRAVIVQEDMYLGRPVDLLVFAADVLCSIPYGYQLPAWPRSPRTWELLFRAAAVRPDARIIDYWSTGPIRRAGTVIWSLTSSYY